MRPAFSPEETKRAWFAGLLRKAFPDVAYCDEKLANEVAKVLTTERRPCNPKTVRNWLRGDNAPHFRYVLPVLALAGAEGLFQIIDPENRK